MLAITLAAEMLLMTLIGVFARKSNIVGKEFSKYLTSFLMKLALPALTFHSVRSATEFSVEALTDCALVVVVSIAVLSIGFGIGQTFYFLSGKSGTGRILRYAVTFSHFSFMGIPMMDAFFGEIGTFYYVFFMLPIRIVYYMLSDSLMIPPDQTSEKRTLGTMIKEILLTPALIGLALGLIFWITGWELPTAIDYCVRQCSALCSPLGLILCGLLLGEYDMKRLWNLRYLKIPLIRLIAMPAIFFVFSRGLLLLGVEKLVCDIVVVFSALPAASLLPAYTAQYDPDPENHFTAAGTCVISTLLSTITLPIWFSLI